MWKFEICEDWNTIWSDAYQERWKHIMSISPKKHVFFHPSLVKVWAKYYLPLRNLSPIFIFGKELDSGNEAFIPFVLWKRNLKSAFLHTIVPAGYSGSGYHDPIFTKPASCISLSDFWSEIVFRLKVYHPDNIILDGLHTEYLPERYNVISEDRCPYILLDRYDNIEDFKRSLNTKRRRNINRGIKNAQEEGILKFMVYTAENISNALTVLPLMLSFHSRSCPNACKPPHFYENLVSEGLKSGIMHFSQINLNRIPISWRIGFAFNHVFYSYMPTIDPEYQYLSPGKIHLLFCIEQAIKNKMYFYGQLRGKELYNYGWTDSSSVINHVQLYSNNIISQGKLLLSGVNPFCGKVLTKH